MSFALLAPLGLAALAALVVPIVIHLVRRLELRTTEFAALRCISERIRPRRRLRFERPWLLLLRLALLALLALLLAKPVLREPPGLAASRVLVAPAGSAASASRRRLATGTPVLGAGVSIAGKPGASQRQSALPDGAADRKSVV